jgi:hypothetical protein
VSAYFVREGIKDVAHEFIKETNFSGLVAQIINTGEHFVVQASLPDGFWYHDGCHMNGMSNCNDKASEHPTYFVVAIEGKMMVPDWELRIKNIKVTNKWTKLSLACRFNKDKAQVVRSCSVDACTVVIALMREVCVNEVEVFKIASGLTKPSRQGSTSELVRLQTSGLRNDFARLVVGVLKTFAKSKDEPWMSLNLAWDHIEDGYPEFADWDAAEVLVMIAACSNMQESTVQRCIQASYPLEQQLTLDDDMKEEQEQQQKAAIDKKTLRTTRAAAEESRTQVAMERFKTALRRGFHGFDSKTGAMRTKMTDGSDIMDRVHVSGRWEQGGKQDQTRIAFILMKPSTNSEHKLACEDQSGTYTTDLRHFDAGIGPRLSGFYCEKKDAFVFAPMLAIRDADKHTLLITAIHQGNGVGTIPDAYDPSSRHGPGILQVWDPSNDCYEFKEFENFVDFNTIDPEQLGCLLNSGHEQTQLLKEYCVADSMQTFMSALRNSHGFKDGMLKSVWHLSLSCSFL